MREFNYRLEALHQELQSGNSKNSEEFLKIIEELIKENDPEGFNSLGYAYYLGYPTFGHDYTRALKAFLKVLEIINDPYTANTVGYIYYYGRTTNGVPDYEKARKYFLIGAEGKIMESHYKLADLYYNGYGVEQNKQYARDIYLGLYDEALADFVSGEDTKFADLALRLAKVELDLHGKASLTALSYFLEAKHALELRENTRYVGDKKLYQSVVAEIAAINEERGIKFTKDARRPKYAKLNFNRDIRGINRLNYALACTVRPSENGKALITLTDLFEQKFLVTISELNYVERVAELVIELDSGFENPLDLLFVKVFVDEETGRVTLTDAPDETYILNFKEMKLKL